MTTAPCGCPTVQVADDETRVIHLIGCNDQNVNESALRFARKEVEVRIARKRT